MSIFDLIHSPSRTTICLMGVNGCGKTRYLDRICSQLRQVDSPTFFIRASRNVQTFSNNSSVGTPVVTGDISQLLQRLSDPRSSEQVEIGNIALRALEEMNREDERDLQELIQETTDWIQSDYQGPRPLPKPVRTTSLLKSLSEIFGYELRWSVSPLRRAPVDMRVLARINDEEIDIAHLSDGERQIFAFSMLLLQASESPITLFVDEPELHLNEARAIALWENIEKHLPHVTFVYATHSLAFATRSTINALFVMEKGEDPKFVDRSNGIDDRLIRDLVGARIQLRHRDSHPIFCEDNAQKILLSDLLDPLFFEPITLGSWESVKVAVKSDEAFRKIVSGSVAKTGVVDRDLRSAAEIEKLENAGIIPLPFNEAESVFIHPDLVHDYLINLNSLIKKLDYKKLLVKAAKRALSETISKLKSQVERESSPKIHYELDSDGLIINAKAEACSDVEIRFRQRHEAIVGAINMCDVNEILKVFKGKKLYKYLRIELREKYRIDVPENAAHLYLTLKREVNWQEKIRSIKSLSEFAKKIEARHNR